MYIFHKSEQATESERYEKEKKTTYWLRAEKRYDQPISIPIEYVK